MTATAVVMLSLIVVCLVFFVGFGIGASVSSTPTTEYLCQCGHQRCYHEDGGTGECKIDTTLEDSQMAARFPGIMFDCACQMYIPETNLAGGNIA